MSENITMQIEKVKCPYCGTIAVRDMHTRRVACECRRLHEYKDLNGKNYNVLYKKDGTKEVIKWK